MKFNERKELLTGQGVWTVTIDGKEWKEFVERGKNKVRNSVVVPGFRKGKAPAAEIEKNVTSDRYLREAMGASIASLFEFARENKVNVEPWSSPVPKPIKISDNEFVLEFIFDLKPAIKIGKYTGLKSSKLVKEEAKATKAEIDASIEGERTRMALEKTKPATASIAKGDEVIFDFEGFVDGVQFAGGKAENYKLVIGSGQFIPEFEDGMIGKKIGKTSVNVKFPKDYDAKLAGKAATFELVIKEIKEKILPKKDDELALDLNIKGVTNMAELEAYVSSKIVDQKETQNKNIFVNEVIELIKKNSTIELPKSSIESTIDDLYREFEGNVLRQQITMKDYMKQTGLSREAIRSELTPDAVARLSSFLITDEIRNKEKFEISEMEIDIELKKFAANFGMEVDYALDKFITKDQIREQIMKEKIVDFLYKNNG
ncbi:trigger factor [Spiroplasma sp. TIUS-1]|uniref:trigger factor n=1 Tax=Spiroplasma sp. TIUS-1 TaxID=216963 RepID=UPI001398501A|nr:trigger factor [Spiroplasma sp. TIUS-1]QHX35878.1 trigger factor [Spiroplasma sp. TIUS-1]